jgi:hypothetical protein
LPRTVTRTFSGWPSGQCGREGDRGFFTKEKTNVSAPKRELDAAQSHPKPPQGHLKATTEPYTLEYRATPRLPQGYPKATSRLPQGYLKATSRLPQGYPKATPRLPQGYPKATSRLPQSLGKGGKAERWGGSLVFSSLAGQPGAQDRHNQPPPRNATNDRVALKPRRATRPLTKSLWSAAASEARRRFP